MPRSTKSGLLITAPIVVVFVSRAHAHLRWFASDEKLERLRYPVDAITISIVLGAAAYMALALVVDRTGVGSKVAARLDLLRQKIGWLDWRLVGFAAGLMLVANALGDPPVYLAPNVELGHPFWKQVYSIGQLLIGVLLLSQLSFALAGLLILLVCALNPLVVPLAVLMDYQLEFLALGCAFLFLGPQLSRFDRRVLTALGIAEPERFAHVPLPAIRIGVGATLVVLAVHNKLSDPSLAVAFLQEYPFNFMATLGFASFTDLHFAFAAGIAEATFGLLLLLGIATRFVTAGLAVFFITTVTQLPLIELAGHAPLIGIAVLLILRGSGDIRWSSSVLRPPAGAA